MSSELTKDLSSTEESWEGVTGPHTLAHGWQMGGGAGPRLLPRVTSHSGGTEEKILLRPPYEEPKVPWHLAHLNVVLMWPQYSVLWGPHCVMDEMVRADLGLLRPFPF